MMTMTSKILSQLDLAVEDLAVEDLAAEGLAAAAAELAGPGIKLAVLPSLDLKVAERVTRTRGTTTKALRQQLLVFTVDRKGRRISPKRPLTTFARLVVSVACHSANLELARLEA